MPTVVEALADATAELHNAALLYQTRADQVAANLASFTSSAQTIINNYVNRSPIAVAWVDENVGVDDLSPGRGGLDTKPFKTVDFALDNTDQSVARVIYLLTDVTMKNWHRTYDRVVFAGQIKIPGIYGAPYSYVSRKFRFTGEAIQSPRLDLGRVVPFFDCGGMGGVEFQYCDIIIPATVAGINYYSLIAGTTQNFSFWNCNFSVETAGTAAKLITCFAGSIVVTFAGCTFGANVPGKLFDTVAAGANPNANYAYRTNIASA